MKKTKAVIMLISLKLVLVCEDICNYRGATEKKKLISFLSA